MASKTTIFAAKNIITMYSEHPHARAVAVRDGRILAVGELDEVTYWVKQSPFTPYEVDTTFQDKVLMPGLVDAHTHVEYQALLYNGHFVSQTEWPRPGGGFFPVYPTKGDVLRYLKELDEKLPPGELLYAPGYDENKIGEGFHRTELDEISTTRPILISNLVFHRYWINSYLLDKAGITAETTAPEIERDVDGKPNGVLLDAGGLGLVFPAIPDFIDVTEEKIRRILPLFSAGGTTTLYDAGFGTFNLQGMFDTCTRIFSDPSVKLRMLGGLFALHPIREGATIDELIEKLRQLEPVEPDKFRLGPVKLYSDGSIISHTAYVGWPGYWDGSPEGQWQCEPGPLGDMLIRLHEEGFSTVTHANSRPGVQAVLDAVEKAQLLRYRPDMRHRVDHAYNITEAQLRKAKELGVNVQFFTTQIGYYGDDHLKVQGPNRAHNMCPTGTANRIGTSWGFHNDPPGTPQLPWMGVWATVNRKTMDSGTVLGPNQCMSVEDTLRALTLEHAYQLHIDHEVGSIEFGKKADFCVLEADPLEIDPMELKDIPVWGTIFGGELNPAK